MLSMEKGNTIPGAHTIQGKGENPCQVSGFLTMNQNVCPQFIRGPNNLTIQRYKENRNTLQMK